MSEPRDTVAPRPPFKGARISNVEASLPTGGGAICLLCEFAGHRYHVWADPETLELKDLTLYKNPSAGLTDGDDGYFVTRRLQPTTKLAEWLIAELRREVQASNLIERARAAERERLAVEAAQRAAARLAVRKEAAADELFALLCVYVDRFAGQDQGLERKARSLLERIENGR